jgi:YD repeat-containing protein
MNRRKFILLLVCALAARQAAAQQHPNVEKGFKPDHAYSVSDLDAVNLFNGNLNVTVPIGGTYPVSQWLSYGFTLAYAGNNWEHKNKEFVQVLTFMSPPNPPSTEGVIYWAVPYQKLNAGMGWLFSLGRLIPSRPDEQRWAYQAPDGSEHELFPSLHEGSGVPTDPNVTYTRGGDYIRSTKLFQGSTTIGYKLEFDDGTIREFGTDGRLKKIQDRFANTVTVDYYGTPQAATGAGVPAPNATACGNSYLAWKISDPFRTHYVYFRPPGTGTSEFEPPFEERVCQASLAAFGGNRADYRFTYAERLISRQKVSSGIAFDETLRPSAVLQVPLLTKVELPSGSSYDMTYDIGMHKPAGMPAIGRDSDDAEVPNEVSDLALALNPGSFSGHLRELRLPTKGRFEWDYQRFVFPPKYGNVSDPMDPSELMGPTVAAGVREKRKYVSESDPARWSYSQSFLSENPWGRTTAVVTVAAPDGSTTDSYFSLFWENGLARRNDYGAPFTGRLDMTYKGMFLSSKTTVPGGERRTYVTYEQDPIADVWDSMEANRRLKSRLTVFEDGSEVQEVSSSFDGLGHYRTTTTTGTAGPLKRVTTRNYNPTTAADGQRVIATTDPWITETYDSADVQDLDPATNAVTDSARTEACFDTSTGFPLRKRTVRGSAASTIDLLTVYKDVDNNGANTDGNVSQEEYYGGDDTPLPGSLTANTCGALSVAPRYRLLYTYASGTRKTSQYEGFTFKFLDLTIDVSSGLPSQTRDVSSIGTTLQYDLMGRLTSIAPMSATERRVTSTYVYAEATSTTGPSVTVQHDCPSVSSSCLEAKLPEARYYYDFFGRLVQQRSSMGSAGTSPWSVSTIAYDIAGRRKTSSVSTGATSGTRSEISPPATVWDYDILGRTTKITQPDGSVVDYAYTSPTVTTRTAKIMTAAGEAAVTTAERSDALGRLVEVTEDSTSAQLHTFYGYDVGDRLVRVTDGNPGIQTRTFDYDGAGLLAAESHPESGETHYQYDARGHVTRRVSGPASNGSTLLFAYDGAERLLTVDHDPDGAGLTFGSSVLKQFQYGTTGFRLGRLWTAKRFNYQSDLGGNGIATVLESFSYDTSGLLSSKQTQVALPGSTTTTFGDSYTYDALGGLETVDYPSCSVCPSMTIQNFYDRGYLTSVGNYASSILYHPNGMWAEVRRPKAKATDPDVVETQTLAADQMSRPLARSVTGHCAEITVTGPFSKTVSPNADSNLSVNAPAGSTFQWYANDQPIMNATGSALHVPVAATTSYWVRVSKNGCSADSAVAVVTVNDCSTPSISAPGTVPMHTTSTASVSQSGTYLWTIDNGTITGNTSTQQQVQFLPGCSGSVTLHVQFTPSCAGGQPVTLDKVIPIEVPAIQLDANPSSISPTESSFLTVGISAPGSWTIAWAAVLSPSQVTGSATIQVTPQSTTTYEIVQVNGCSMSPWASATVTVAVPPPAPLTTTATRNGPASVLVSWTKPANAVIDSYRIERCTSSCLGGGTWSLVGAGTGLTFNDGGAIANGAYAYRVVSVTGSTFSTTASPPDFASTYAFTDDPLAVLGTQRAGHVTELRAAANALRALAGLGAFNFTDTLAAGSLSKAVYLTELRTAINQARAPFGRADVTFTAPAPAAGGLPLAAHVNELRGGVQ